MKGVSIIICTYNGKQKLQKTIEHILKLSSFFPWELIIVDNASTDGTFEASQEYLRNASISFKILKQPVPGKMGAFWTGIEHAQYSYVLDCDDDNLLDENYLRYGYSILEENKQIGALGGSGSPVTKIQLPDWFLKFQRSYAIGPQATSSGRLRRGWYLYGAGCFFRLAGLMELKKRGFTSILSCRKGDSLSAGGDTELCMALELLGYETWFSERLTFGHVLDDSRLVWPYFLRLKAGVASSFPLLSAYQFGRFKNLSAFKYYLHYQYWLAWKGFVKTSLQLLFTSNRDIEVSYHLCRTKIKMFRRNYSVTTSAYQHLKRVFNGR
jgi:glycosyltransferase involved in cell wall biosynthesis